MCVTAISSTVQIILETLNFSLQSYIVFDSSVIVGLGWAGQLEQRRIILVFVCVCVCVFVCGRFDVTAYILRWSGRLNKSEGQAT